MNITVVCVGRLKEKYLVRAVEEYKKRLRSYCRLKIIEVEDEKTWENMSKREEELVKAREGERILKAAKPSSYVIALAIEGVQMSSEDLADYIQDLGVKGKSDITFIIGGSIGLSDEVLSRSHLKLSFSLMTFPHQLMRVILLEQIYRSFKIIRGEPYHK
ncbi:MAG TPA: 23S rRNA (pseudouridine(1915)-N(3))-methyltransferase RlmH [Clostridiales bacterium]|nr:23S rRNA (pseudouridine(1915)-N(3))-methyltransferase RlmH [Clostridiales bacterium]